MHLQNTVSGATAGTFKNCSMFQQSQGSRMPDTSRPRPVPIHFAPKKEPLPEKENPRPNLIDKSSTMLMFFFSFTCFGICPFHDITNTVPLNKDDTRKAWQTNNSQRIIFQQYPSETSKGLPSQLGPEILGEQGLEFA